MRIGLCTSLDKFPIAGVEGLDFLEGAVADLFCPRQGESEFAQRLSANKAAPKPVEAANCLFPGDLRLTGPAAMADAADAHLRVVCERARRMGVRVLVFGAGGARRAPEGFEIDRAAEQLVEHMKRWAPTLQAAGVTLVLEPLNRGETNVVNTVAQGAELVRRVAHPAVRLLADTYHMTLDGEGPEAIRQAGDLIVHSHCAEAKGRVPVGFGGEDQRAYFAALKAGGRCERLSIEAKFGDLASELPRALALLREQVGG